MADYPEVLAALPNFRNNLLRRQMDEAAAPAAAMSAFTTRGAFSAFSTPVNNVHATGVGIRCSGGKYHPKEFALKIFVFDTVDREASAVPLAKEWEGLPIDVEALPVQLIRAASRSSGSGGQKPLRARRAKAPNGAKKLAGATAVLPQRQRFDPVVGGVSISPLDAEYVGTLGCFVKRQIGGRQEFFVLSNNHVLADVDRLPIGTQIVQPGPEAPPYATPAADVFARLHTTIPIHFPKGAPDTQKNRFDAALAIVTDNARIAPERMFGGIRYDPASLKAPTPGMRVMKAGRTTGVTRGTVTATKVRGIQVNYGTAQMPRLAVYEECITIAGDAGAPFSLPGDSGSVILEEATGGPVALLFAGDGRTTTACDLSSLCEQLRVWPA